MPTHLDQLHRLHKKLRLRYGERDPFVLDLEDAIRLHRERELAQEPGRRVERRTTPGRVADRRPAPRAALA